MICVWTSIAGEQCNVCCWSLTSQLHAHSYSGLITPTLTHTHHLILVYVYVYHDSIPLDQPLTRLLIAECGIYAHVHRPAALMSESCSDINAGT